MITSTNIKPTATILIIDDDRRRDQVYELFFTALSGDTRSNYLVIPLIAKNPSAAIQSLAAREPSLVVLDMMLNGEWAEKADQIYSALGKSKCPLSLLSQDFSAAAAIEKVNQVLDRLVENPKLGFWPYGSNFERHCRNTRTESIELTASALPSESFDIWNIVLATALKHDISWKPRVPGEVTFLHLTDTHFGISTPDYLNAVAISNGAKGVNNPGGAAALIADYLVWTGDITNFGLPREFDQAKQFALDIKDAKLLPKSSPISIVPGNHDLCWPLSLSSRMSLDDILIDSQAKSKVNPSATTDEKKHQRWNVKDTAVNPDLWRFGTQPYRDFYGDVVGELAPSTDIGFRWHTQWAHLGFAIFELPIEAHVVQSNTSTAKPPPFVSEEEFKKITISAIKSFQESSLKKNVCIIFLIHGRTPDQPTSGSVRWTELVDRIEESGHATIIFGGHEHAATHEPKGRRLTIIGVPHDSKQSSETNSLPGVGFIRVLGLGTPKLKCEITKVQQGTGDTDPSKWVQLPPKRFEIAAADPHPWAPVTVFSSSHS